MTILLSATTSKFLFALLAWIAFAATTTDAATVRGHRNANQPEERNLKGAKNGASSNAVIVQSTPGVTATTSSVTVTSTTNAIDTAITDFETGCGAQANALETCVLQGGGGISLCRTCILGVASLSSASIAGVNACSNPTVSGGFCNGCYQQGRNYYNCGTGSNMAEEVTGDLNAATITGGTVTAGMGSATVTGGTVTAGLVNSFSFAPGTSCPFTTVIVSGDSCVVPGDYDALRCLIPGKQCTCRADENMWLCVGFP